jgi:hypothetical protein
MHESGERFAALLAFVIQPAPEVAASATGHRVFIQVEISAVQLSGLCLPQLPISVRLQVGAACGFNSWLLVLAPLPVNCISLVVMYHCSCASSLIRVPPCQIALNIRKYITQDV